MEVESVNNGCCDRDPIRVEDLSALGLNLRQSEAAKVMCSYEARGVGPLERRNDFNQLKLLLPAGFSSPSICCILVAWASWNPLNFHVTTESHLLTSCKQPLQRRRRRARAPSP